MYVAHTYTWEVLILQRVNVECPLSIPHVLSTFLPTATKLDSDDSEDINGKANMQKHGKSALH